MRYLALAALALLAACNNGMSPPPASHAAPPADTTDQCPRADGQPCR